MQQMINVAIITNSIGGVKTPPYSTIGKVDVGADARHRPASVTLYPLSPSIACQKTSVGGGVLDAPDGPI